MTSKKNVSIIQMSLAYIYMCRHNCSNYSTYWGTIICVPSKQDLILLPWKLVVLGVESIPMVGS